MKKYSLTKEKRDYYRNIILLRDMIEFNEEYPIMLTDSQELLEPHLIDMCAQDKRWVEMRDNMFVPTQKGREEFKGFMNKYYDYLRIYDIFCMVDFQTAEFAFSKYMEYDDSQWDIYVDDDRWQDVRLAVCEFKGIDPVEVAVMSFLNEERFGIGDEGWEFRLVSDLLFDEMLDIINDENTYRKEDLMDNGALEDIIKRGFEVMMHIFDEEKRLENEEKHQNRNMTFNSQNDEEELDLEEEDVDVRIYTREELYLYNDPYYYSPYWI